MRPARNYVHLGERIEKQRRKGAVDVTSFIRKNALLHRRRQSNDARLTAIKHFKKRMLSEHFPSKGDNYLCNPAEGQMRKGFPLGNDAFSLQVRSKCMFLTLTHSVLC